MISKVSLLRFLCVLLSVSGGSIAVAESPSLSLDNDESSARLTIRMADQELLTYQYGEQYALPHYWPVRSPAGKLLTVQHPDPYPHHRSLWIADKVKVDGQVVDFYHVQRNYMKKGDPESGFRHFIRHKAFSKLEAKETTATVQARLEWIVDQQKSVIDETRTLRVVSLGKGEYLLDLSWELKPTAQEVTVVSDWVHYAWPYVRIHPQFSGDKGGTIQDDQGRQGQGGTNEKYAQWIDYSNTVDGKTEGLAVFIYPDGRRHKWLTRDYGTFGPRRPDSRSGKPITLKPGESLTGRAGLLIHSGGVETGRIAERFKQYTEGKL